MNRAKKPRRPTLLLVIFAGLAILLLLLRLLRFTQDRLPHRFHTSRSAPTAKHTAALEVQPFDPRFSAACSAAETQVPESSYMNQRFSDVAPKEPRGSVGFSGCGRRAV
jgi:hypothetical protein